LSISPFTRVLCGAFLALVVSVAAFSQTPPAMPIDGIAAIVQDDIQDDVIFQSELDQSVASVKLQFQSHGRTLPDSLALQRQVLDYLILSRVQSDNDEGEGLIGAVSACTKTTEYASRWLPLCEQEARHD